MTKRLYLFVSTLAFLLSLFAGEARASDAQSTRRAPFDAWVSVESVSVMPAIGRLWPSIAILHYGDLVHVMRCDPDCDSPSAWVELSPFGAVRRSALEVGPRDARGSFLGSDAPSFTWARVVRAGAVSRAAPSEDAPVVERLRRDAELAFRVSPELEARGYLERPDGSFVSTRALEVFAPSAFAGWHAPPERFAFVRTGTELTSGAGTRPVSRYERFAITSMMRDRVVTPEGTLPRDKIRIGHARRRPSRVPANARWVHIDLAQQVLTAYEGDRLVFATLVSTGRVEGTTRPGVFEVRRKIRFTTMRGGGARDPYTVEGVPHVLYFDGAVALHGAFWHDGFGQTRSHGCVNLSPADARFLFGFAPTEVPEGWRSINPPALGTSSLFVVVEG